MTGQPLVHVLGPLAVTVDGKPVALRGPRQLAILARLTLAAGQAVSAERLIEDVWGQEAPDKVLGSLQAYISTLRKAIEPIRTEPASPRILLTRGRGYALLADSDAHLVTSAVSEAARHLVAGRPADASAVLEGVEWLWRGEPYADVADEGWVQPEVARLREVRLVGRELALETALALGRAIETVPALEQLVNEQPLREGPRRLLVLAYYRSGRQADALAALREARTVLAEELGVDPGWALKELESQVLAQSRDLDVDIPTSDVTEVATEWGHQVPVGAATSTSAREATGDPPFVGRETVLDLVAMFAESAESGHARALLLDGEPGIGKTTLAHVIVDRLTRRGWANAWGRCPPSNTAPPLWLWQQILNELAIAHPLPERLQALSNGEPERGFQDAAAARFAQHRAVAKYITEVATVAPLVLVLDDLQWADDAALAILADLVSACERARLLVLGTVRAGEGKPSLTAAAHAISRAGGTRAHLSGLTLPQAGEVVEHFGQDVDLLALMARTGGNPFFITETLRAARLGGGEDLLEGVPQSVADAIRIQFATLGSSAVDLLQTAGVLGRDLDLDLIQAVSDASEEALFEAVDAAVAAGLLAGVDTGDLRFRHDLVRETVRGEIAPLRRRKLHERAVQVLSQRPMVPASQVAAHALRAGPASRAAVVEWSERAADEASERYAYGDAVNWLNEAVRTATTSGESAERVVGLLLRLVRAQVDAGDAYAAVETRSVAIRAADRVGDSDLQINALVVLDQPNAWHMRAHDSVGLTMVGRLERALSTGVEGTPRIRLIATLALELYDGSADPRCDEFSAEAIRLAQEAGDPDLLSFTLGVRSLVLPFPRHPADLAALASQMLEVGRTNNLPRTTLVGHQLAAQASARLADLSGAWKHCAQATQLARELQLPLAVVQQRMWDASRAMAEGRHDDAFAAMDDVERDWANWWDKDGLMSLLRLPALVRAGRLAAALPLADQVERLHPAIAHDARLLALIAGSRSDEVEALGAHSWPAVAPDWMWLPASCLRAQAVAACGRVDLAGPLREQLAAFRGQHAITGTVDYGPVDTALEQLDGVLRV